LKTWRALFLGMVNKLRSYKVREILIERYGLIRKVGNGGGENFSIDSSAGLVYFSESDKIRLGQW